MKRAKLKRKWLKSWGEKWYGTSWSNPTPEERRRAQAFILGVGVNCALRPNADGKIRIGIEEDNEARL
jgi:hypothetical protein